MIRAGSYKIVPVVTKSGWTRWHIRRGLFALDPSDLHPNVPSCYHEEWIDWATPEEAIAALVRSIWAHGSRIRDERRRRQAVATAKAAKPKVQRWP
jgi:hypothetical protein